MAIDEAHMFMPDGVDTLFTLKWTGPDIVKENHNPIQPLVLLIPVALVTSELQRVGFL